VKKFISILIVSILLNSFVHAEEPATQPAAEGTLLVDLTPSATEWGTEVQGQFPDMKFGPRVVDWMSAGNQGGLWPKSEQKIVKEVEKDKQLPEGKAYSSGMEDCFAVGGEFMTGVGLWARRMTFYHQLDYAIPEKSKTFTAKLYVSDDPRGFQWWGNANQQFAFTILIDDKEVEKVEKTRLTLQPGSGELLKEISVAIPEGAKSIRFRLINSPWGDGNANVELIINDGIFASPD